ncbi:MAG: hypothetical protein QM750_18085 [Rubrivivax sp.]
MARFGINIQFTNSGTFSSTVHFQGTVSADPPSSPYIPQFAYLREYVQLRDLTTGTLETAGYSICTSQVFDCASVQPSISTDFTVSTT